MPRARSGVPRHRRKKRLEKRAKGYYGGRRRLYRSMLETVTKAGVDAYFGRKLKKRDYRRLWITRLSAAARACGISYSRLMEGLRKAQIELNRKTLSELAIHDSTVFNQLVQTAKNSLSFSKC